MFTAEWLVVEEAYYLRMFLRLSRIIPHFTTLQKFTVRITDIIHSGKDNFFFFHSPYNCQTNIPWNRLICIQANPRITVLLKYIIQHCMEKISTLSLRILILGYFHLDYGLFMLDNGFVILANGLLRLDKGFFIRNVGFVIFLMEFFGPNPFIPGLFVPVILLVLDVMLWP